MTDDADWSAEASWMDLANMHGLGRRLVQLYCSCHHGRSSTSTTLADRIKVPNVRRLFRCFSVRQAPCVRPVELA